MPISVNFDKMVVQESDTVFGSAIVFVVLGGAFVIIALLVVSGCVHFARDKKRSAGQRLN